MSDIEKLTPQNLLLLLQFVAPGFLAVYFRSLFVRRAEASFKDNLLLFVVISLIYGFVTLPLWQWLGSASGFRRWVVWLISLVVVPIAGGMLLGVAAQRGLLRRVLARFKLYPLSPYRTGWDWAFGQVTVTEPVFLIVTLDDGSSVAGLFGRESLAASEHSYRDLYLETVYDVDPQQGWMQRQPRQSILISGKTIRYVEFSRGETS